MTAPRLLILASAHTYRLEPFLAAARRLGVEVTLGLDVPPAHTASKESFLGLDFRDVDRSIQQAQAYAVRRRLRAVLPTDDATVTLAAHLSEALDLPHNAVEAAEAARDKHLMRQMFARAGLPTPWFRLASASDDPARLAAETRYPCVLKPTCLAGSRGVIRADDPGEFRAAFARLKAILVKAGLGELLIEGYIPGIEVALEGLLAHGKLKVLALFDKPDPLKGPFFEETIYVTPSRLPAETQAAIFAVAAEAARALGLREGPVHAEFRINDAGVWPLEIAGRSIGGLCSQTLRFAQSAEMSLEELILRQAIGEDIASVEREARAGGVMMIPIPSTAPSASLRAGPGAGTLAEVSGLEAAQAVPGIESVEITAKINYPLVPLPEGEGYLGFIFARGETPGEVESALRAAHRALHFEIAPELPQAA
jgi:biotin carboxylase